jgi:hypothetical protein
MTLLRCHPRTKALYPQRHEMNTRNHSRGSGEGSETLKWVATSPKSHHPRTHHASHGDDDDVDDDDGDDDDVREDDTDDDAAIGGDATGRGANDARTRGGDSRVRTKRNGLGRRAGAGRTRNGRMYAGEERWETRG